VVATDAGGGHAIGGMSPLDMILEVMPPLELPTTPFLLALEACAKVILEQVGDGPIATVVAVDRPPAVAEAAMPATILLVLTINLPKEREEDLLGRLHAVWGAGNGVDGRKKSGVVGRFELGLKGGEIEAEVSSLIGCD